MTREISMPRLLALDPNQVELDTHGTRAQAGDIAGLASSIAVDGLLQPIGVRQETTRAFSRRLRSASTRGSAPTGTGDCALPGRRYGG